jgi:ribosome-binding factor A
VKQTPRTRKLSESVKEAIAQILATEVSDPRLDLVTVTDVQVSSDVMLANVYVTAHGDEERYEDVLAGLESAKGRIRALLGKRIKARFTPELRFFIDDSVDEGMRITEALRHVPPTLAGDDTSAEEADAPGDDTADAVG